MNTKQIIVIVIFLIFIIFTGYSAFGDSTPTRDDLIRNKIEQYQEDNARIKIHNEMTEDICDKESKSITDPIESTKSKLTCLEKDIKKLIDIDKEIQKEFGTGSVNSWTSSSGTVATAPERTVNLRSIFNLWNCRFTNDKHKMPKYKLEWLAYDIACDAGKAFNVSTPNFNKESWTVATVSYGKSIGNYVIIKQWDIRIVYGHTSTQKKEWDILTSWEVFWITDMSWESTWMHLHLELWKWYKIVSREFLWSDTYDSWDQTRLLAHRNWNFEEKIYRNWKYLESINYAWNKWKDIDFIATIEQESRWDQDAISDIDNPKPWAYSYWYCQYNSTWHLDKINYYKSLPSWKEKIDWCHDRYIEAMDRKWWIGSLFHWYNVRDIVKNRFSFE